MKDHLKSLVAEHSDPMSVKNTAREYLQARILQSLQEQGAFTQWAFLGGTALRFLFRLPRYSEDLDFSAVQPFNKDEFLKQIQKIKTSLERETYTVDIKPGASGAVASVFIKFRGLPFEMGISPHESEVLSIRVEVDTNPPAGAATETTVVRRHVMLNILHYDKASMLAGKLHAILARRFTKGRDLFDLAWYLADPECPEPNLDLLNNALLQTGWDGPRMTRDNWRDIIARHLQDIAWERAREDVRPFLENQKELAFVDKNIIMDLLKSRRGR
jgi:predicted nucleotidyltransferase component of viral defense system